MPKPPRGTEIVAFEGRGLALRDREVIGWAAGEMKVGLKNCNLFAIRKM
jgi:hypothetical protein